MLYKIIGIADLFIPNDIASDPQLAKLARRYQAVSRMQLIIISNMVIFDIPLLIFGDPGRPLPFVVLAIAACVLLGLMTLYYFQTFIVPLLISLLGSVGFMFFGMLITGGISSPFVFMIMTLPIVTITFGDAVVYKTLYSLIALCFLIIFVLQFTGTLPSEPVMPFTPLEQAVSILGALSITIFGGIHARTQINGVRNALKSAREKAIQEARIDSLTKLYNRRAFMENGDIIIEKMQRHHSKNSDVPRRQLYLLMVDLDYFKNINDTYGHFNGDLVLMEVASSLKHTTRNFENVARLGGEEFALLLESDSQQGALQAAERLRDSIEKLQIELSEQSDESKENISVTISVGICQWHPGDDLNALLKNADFALYTAKRTGRNRVVFGDKR